MAQLKHFPLPDPGEGLTEAEILNWRVQPGDRVELNQIIVEVETAKASVELPCPYEGTVNELLAQPGQTVEVGNPIVAIDLDPSGAATEEQPEQQAGSAASEQAAEGSKIGEESADGRIATLVGYGPRAGSSKRRPRKKPAAAGAGAETGHETADTSRTNGVPAPASPVDAVQSTSARFDTNGSAGTPPRGGHVPLAKPPVRKLAKDLGVDLHGLTGSGTEGVITREDVERAASGPSAAAPAASATAAGERERRVPVKGVRKATAQAMVDSAFTAPHVTEFLTVDVTPMMEFRQRLKSDSRFKDVKVTPLAFAAKALCMAVRRTPDVNAAWDEPAGEIVYKDYIHLGIAAATERGLIVPKVRDADQMSLHELASSLDQLTSTAREGKTAPADLVNGTITITNVGVFGVDTGTPILTPGESAILAFGAIREMPWVVDGQIVPRQVCQLALSFDHRVVDGQQGSQFLADVGAILSDPSMAITF